VAAIEQSRILEPMVEKILAAVWAEALSMKDIGPETNFFDSGGTPALAAQLSGTISRHLGLEPSSTLIAEHPTIRRLSQFLASARPASPASPETPARRSKVEYRASLAQIRLWFLYKIDPESLSYNACSLFRLRGAVDEAALERALTELVRRHEALRTTFHERDGELMQRVSPPAKMAAVIEDLSAVAGPEQEGRVQQLAAQEARRRFNLETGPLIRCMFIRLDHTSRVLVLSAHHIIWDAWSLEIAGSEIEQLYRAYAAGRPSPLPEPPIQYGEFSERQLERLQGKELEQQAVYWREQLAGAPETIALPVDRPHSADTSRQGAYRFELEPNLAEQLRRLGRAHGATLFMTLLAGFQVLISRYADQEDFCVGTPVANRTQLEIENTIGFFVNTLVLRCNLEGNPGFTEFLKRTRETTLSAFGNQELPFQEVVGLLHPGRSVESTPFLQAMFSLQNVPRSARSHSLMAARENISPGSAKFDLSLLLEEQQANGGSISGTLAFNAGLFEHSTIEQMATHYVRLLAAIAGAPESRVKEIRLLDKRERRMLLEEWNATGAEYSLEGTIVDRLEAAASQWGAKHAVRGPEDRLTYQELNARANQLAFFLAERGTGPGAIVGICMERSALMVACMAGVLKTGAACLPLDPAAPSVRTVEILRDAAATVLTQHHLRGLFDDAALSIVEVDQPGFAASLPSSNPAWRPSQNSAAYVIHTWDPTGDAKGVKVSHRSLLNLALWHQHEYKVGPEDHASQLAAASMDACVWEIWPNLAAGATLEIAGEEIRLSQEKVKSWLVERGITLAFVPAALAEPLVREPWPENSRLRAFLVAGEPGMTRPAHDLRFPIIHHYGPTEATVVATCEKAAAHDPRGRLPRIGRPISNARVYILDSYLEPVPIGATGQLYIGGEGVALGYAHAPEAEKSRFIQNPFGPGRLYRSGDLARYRKTGEIEFLGRANEQVKIRGCRIELPEIKAVLDERPEVRQSAVLAKEGEQGKVLTAYIVLRQDATLDLDELRAYLGARLPHFMVPSAFVLTPELPLTLNGTLDREKLGALRPREPAQRRAEARSAAEAILREIWAEVLDCNPPGIHDNFFDLGGNSLLAVRVVTQAARKGLCFSVRDMFRHQSIAGLAAQAKSQESAQDLAATGAARDSWPTTPIQRWFFEHDFAFPTLWNTAMLFKAAEEAAGSLLRLAVEALIRKHHVLRLQFRKHDEQWVQYTAGNDPDIFQSFDLSDLPYGEQCRELERICNEVQTSFTFGKGQLVRFAYFHLGPQGARLLMSVHHLICDGVSLGVLISDLAAMYRSLASDADPEESSTSSRFVDWVARLHSPASLEKALAEQPFWAPKDIVPIPVDHPGGKNTVGSVQSIRVELDAAQTSALVRAGYRDYQAGVDLLLTWAAASALMQWTGSRSAVINLVGHGRETEWPDMELPDTVGFLSVHYPFYVQFPADLPPREAIARVRSQFDRIPNHGFGYGILRFIYNQESDHPPVPVLPEPEFGINYVGNMDSMFADIFPFTLAGEKYGALRHPEGQFLFKMGVIANIRDGKLRADWMFSTNLYDRETVEKVVEDFRSNLLSLLAEEKPSRDDRQHAAVAVPERQAATPALLPEEREPWLPGGQTGKESSRTKNVAQLFEEQAARTPRAIAVEFEGRQLTYAELNRRSNRLANYLRGLGAKPETLIGICVERGLEMVVSVLGAVKAGAAYVPLDPAYPAERIAYILEDARAPFLLTQARLRDGLPAYGGAVILLDQQWELISRASDANPDPALQPENVAYVLYTSGSTGKPKGVQVPHRALTNLLTSMAQRPKMHSEDILLAVTTLCFDIAMLELFLPLLCGARLRILSRESAMDGVELLRQVNNGATVLQATPVSWLMLLEAGWQSSKRLKAFCGGEALSPDLAKKLASRCRSAWNMYGPTETTIYSLIEELKDVEGKVPIGKPIAHTLAYVLDERMEPLPAGTAGELYIGGDGLARGYMGRSDLTAEKFVPNPFSATEGERLYRTGDWARRLDNGKIECLGRMDHQVKLNGYRIELGEIESVLLEYPGIERAVAMVRENQRGDKQLVAYFVAGKDQRINTGDLQAFLGRKLPRPMMPSQFVALPKMPLTANGKIDRKALPEGQGQEFSHSSRI
jgi:amino acid adenylation domain-containing protein/non-ribosomal peptide synthase protein (TIGR01720 family)